MKDPIAMKVVERRYVRKMLPQNREDARQTIRLALWKYRDRWKPDMGTQQSSFETTLAEKCALNCIRGSVRYSSPLVSIEKKVHENGATIGDGLIATSESAEEQYATAERHYIVQQLLSLLPDSDADMLYRYFWLDQPFAEIAMAHGCSRQTAMRRIEEAVTSIRKRMSKCLT